MLAATLLCLTIPIQARAAGDDTLAVRDRPDSTGVTVATTPTSGSPRRSLTRVAAGSAPISADSRRGNTDTTTAQQRRAVEHSDWYYRRLTVHKVASYTTVPLFVTEYVLGDKLYSGDASSSVRSAHQAVATGIGVLFGVNTVTGVWNLWDSRHEQAGRARRFTHAALMLMSDAGFVACPRSGGKWR